MKTRSYASWPILVPKTLDIEKPLSEYIRDWSEMTPEKIAVRFYGKDLTFRELNESSDRFAQGLISLGVKKGDRIGLHLQNCPQFIISYFGILRAGGVVVAMNPMFKKAELEHELNDAGVETMVCMDVLYPEVETIRGGVQLKHIILTSLGDYIPDNPVLKPPPEALEPKHAFPGTIDFIEFLNTASNLPICDVADMHEELALLQYTGGTTGIPKGAMISHYSLAFAGLSIVHWDRLRSDDVSLGVTPFFHVMGMIALMCAPLIAGAQVTILGRFVPDVTAMAISHYRCTFWSAATTMLVALIDIPDIASYDFSSMRLLFSGGSPISSEIQQKTITLFPNAILGEGYGLSETCMSGGILTPLHKYRPGYVGIPFYSDIRIMDVETGKRELLPNEEGEIVIHAPTVMKGYWNHPEETAAVLKAGWLYTGDIGLMDEKGYVKVVGRTKELIICSGYNVFPSEVEDILYRHPAVAEIAVIGIPDPYRGESPKAYIVLKSEFRGSISEEDIISWCRENMAAYKRPHEIEFREDLPKSGAGKLLRRLLMESET